MDGRTVRRTDSGHEVTVVDSVHAVGRRDWNGVVERTPRASVFHRFEWLDAVESGLPYAPRHLVVSKDGNVIGLFPNVVRSVPSTPFRRLTSTYPGCGGPLLPTDTKRALELAVNAAVALCSGQTAIHEIRGSTRATSGTTGSSAPGATGRTAGCAATGSTSPPTTTTCSTA
jgi:hypothetical protein